MEMSKKCECGLLCTVREDAVTTRIRIMTEIAQRKSLRVVGVRSTARLPVRGVVIPTKRERSPSWGEDTMLSEFKRGRHYEPVSYQTYGGLFGDLHLAPAGLSAALVEHSEAPPRMLQPYGVTTRIIEVAVQDLTLDGDAEPSDMRGDEYGNPTSIRDRSGDCESQTDEQ